MEHRRFNAINPLARWLGIGKGPEKLQQLRKIHHFRDPMNTTAERFIGTPEIPQSDTKDPSEIEVSEARLTPTFESGQKHEIAYSFIHHSQSAKKVYHLFTPFLDGYQHYQENLKDPNNLPVDQLQAIRSDTQTFFKKKVYHLFTPFLDSYQHYQENLKGPNNLPIDQLQAMRSDIQTFFKKVEEGLTSDQQLPEAAKKNIKEFLNNHLEGMNEGIKRMKELKIKEYFPYSEVTIAWMDKSQENLAKFVEKLGQAGITNLDQLKENLTGLLNEIEIREIKHKKEIEDIIKTFGRKLDDMSKDRQFAFNEDVSRWQAHLRAAILYKEQARGVTTEGLREQCLILRAANERLDELIEKQIREEVDKWSRQVTDVPCIQPRPGMFRNFGIASMLGVLAFERLANDFHDALKPEKQPEELYRILYSLQGEFEAINRLDNAYDKKHSKTLETALNERFGNPNNDRAQLEYTLQLIKKGNGDAEQAIKHESLDAVAQRIHQALHPNSGDPKIEVVYAALTTFTRSTAWLCNLDRWYNSHFQTGLKSDIETILQRDPKAKAYALFLIGDQVLEKKVRSWSEAVRLQKALLKQTFHRDDGVHVPVPYDQLRQIGTEWTHIMCQALKEGGYESKKIIALSLRVDEHGQKLPNLHVHTDLAPDMPDGKDPIVTSTYRMAPLVQVEASFGMVELVLDPISSKPLTIKQWLGEMGQDSFERIPPDVYKTKLGEESQKNLANPYPADQTYVFTGSCNIPALPFSPDNIDDLLRDKPIPDQDTSHYYQQVGKAAMSKDAEWVPYIRMARFLRKNMQSINDDLSAKHFLNTIATNFLKDVSTFHSIRNTDFSSAFPNLYKNLRAHLAKIDVSASIVERFEKLLSGKHALSGANGDQSALLASSVHNVGTDMLMLEHQAIDAEKAKDTEDQIEVLQQEVDRWPLEEIHIERIQRPIFFRDCKIADVLDFKQLADEFNAALKPEKLPEDLYRVLHSLLREPEAINKLDNAYRRGTDGKTLETTLNERFGKLEDSARLEYALQLINKGNPGAEQVIEPLSAYPSGDELDKVAKRIHLALTQPNSQPEVVYAALTPFERNTELLCKLDAWYNHNFQTGLKSHIEDTLKENLKAKDYALFLLGDQTMEKKEISYYEAMRLWKVVERLTFDRGDGVRVPVPYDYSSDGCQYRAHMMCEVLKEMGYSSEKVLASSYRMNEYDQKMQNLHLRTDLAPDMPGDKDPIIPWGYHIASCIQVKTVSGAKKRLVLDPSLHHRPLIVEKWMKDKLGQDSYEPIELDVYQAKLTEEYQKNPRFFSPLGTYMLIASRKFFSEPDGLEWIEIWLKDKDIPDQFLSEAFKVGGRLEMINAAKWVPYNRMARSIRQELRNPTIQDAKDADAFLNKLATNFLADVSEYRSSTSSAFSNAFPNLYKDLIEYVKARIGHPSDSSSSELFREHLSGKSRFNTKDWRDVPTQVNTQETDLAGPTRVNTQETDLEGPTRTNTGVMPKIDEEDLSTTGNQYVSEPEVL